MLRVLIFVVCALAIIFSAVVPIELPNVRLGDYLPAWLVRGARAPNVTTVTPPPHPAPAVPQPPTVNPLLKRLDSQENDKLFKQDLLKPDLALPATTGSEPEPLKK